MGERKEYLRREDITPEYLDGVLDEITVPHREVLDFVERVEHMANNALPKGAIMMRVAKIAKNKAANIVGFASRSIRVRAEDYREMLVEPFHIKNAYMFGVGDPGYTLEANNTPALAEPQVVRATEDLERRRLNLVVEAFIAMANEKRFMYMDGDDIDNSEIIIDIDYSQDIKDLPDAGSFPNSGGVDFGDAANVKTLYEIRNLKAAYRKQEGIDFTPNLVFINDNTAAQLLSSPDILSKYKPLQSSDPDNIPQTYDGFEYDGIRFIVWHKEYMKDGALEAPVADGYALFTVAEDPLTGMMPMVWHSAENILNRQDASQPRYDGLVEGTEEPDIGVKLYDNGIPAPSRRHIIARAKLFTPA